MKRGRPNIRETIQQSILSTLLRSSVPLSTSAITKQCSLQLKCAVSWNTIQKYLRELIEIGKIEAIVLPHSKEPNKEGLTLYSLKK